MCLSDDAFPYFERMLLNDKYLQTLINKTPSPCCQSEDVDLLLVSGESASPKWHVTRRNLEGFVGRAGSSNKMKRVHTLPWHVNTNDTEISLISSITHGEKNT